MSKYKVMIRTSEFWRKNNIKLCEHVSIFGEKIDKNHFEKCCEYQDELIILCNECQEKYIIGIAIN